jgi:hypothetical protein
LEAESYISPDEKYVSINLFARHAWLKGMTRITMETEKTRRESVIEQPEFEHMQTTTSLLLKSGEQILLGVFPAPEEPGDLELFLLRAEVRKVP